MTDRVSNDRSPMSAHAVRSSSIASIASVLGNLLVADWNASNSGLVTQGGAVSSVPNTGSSSTALAQGNSALRPTEASGVVTSDGSNDQLVCDISPAIASGSRPYLFVVGKLNSMAAPRYLFAFWQTLASSASGGDVVAISINNAVWTFDRRDPGGYQNAAGGVADTKWHVFEVGFTASGTSTMVVDGAGRNSTMSSATDAAFSGMIVHGVELNNATYSSIFSWARILVCSGEPSESQKQSVRAILKNTHAVPSHPIETVKLFSTEGVDPQLGVAQSFGGAAACLGRWVFQAPSYSHNTVARIDSTQDYESAGAWSFLDLSPIVGDADRQWCCGSSLDENNLVDGNGRYFYIAPYDGTSKYKLVRIDALAAETAFDASCVASYDLSALDADAFGFTGAVWCAGAVYLIPSYNVLPAKGLAVRYDESGSFTSLSSYQKFDMTQGGLYPRARGFSLGGTDGRYIYYAPWDAGDAAPGDISGLIVRYDTSTNDFEDAGGWEYYDLETHSTNPTKGLSGGTFDGRYMYFAPVEVTRNGLDGFLFCRFDTSIGLGLSHEASWEFVRLDTLWPEALGYYEAAYDRERYVMFNCFGHGVQLVYDTTLAFTSQSSWTAVDGQSFLDGTELNGLGGITELNGKFYFPNSAHGTSMRVGPIP